MNSKNYKLIIFFLVIGMVLGFGISKLTVKQNLQNKDVDAVKVAEQGEETKKEVVYKTVVAERPIKGEIKKTISFNGEVTPQYEFYLTSKISERIKKINFKNGEKVNKGDVIFEMEPLEYTQLYNQAKSTLDQAKVSYEIAERDLERNKTLFNKKVINDKSMDQIRNAYQIAKSAYIRAKSSYEISKENYEALKVVSPVDGIFVDSNGKEGQLVSKGFDFGRVIKIDKVLVESYISQDKINNIEIGKEAISNGVTGKVVSVNKAADQVSRNYLVKILFDNSKRLFGIGAFVKGSISTEIKKDVNIFNISSLLYDNKGFYIFVKGEKVQEKDLDENDEKIKENKKDLFKVSKKYIDVTIKQEDKVYSKDVENNDYILIYGQTVVQDGETVILAEE